MPRPALPSSVATALGAVAVLAGAAVGGALTGCASSLQAGEPPPVTSPPPAPPGPLLGGIETQFVEALARSGVPGPPTEQLRVGRQMCSAWAADYSYEDTLRTLTAQLPRRQAELFIVIAAEHLCPEHVGTFGG